jgi:hypothetical protein
MRGEDVRGTVEGALRLRCQHLEEVVQRPHLDAWFRGGSQSEAGRAGWGANQRRTDRTGANQRQAERAVEPIRGGHIGQEPIKCGQSGWER